VLHAVTVLAIQKTPMSGKGDELRDFGGIPAAAIVDTVKRLLRSERAGPVMAGPQPRKT
jgi:hypothetical protein